MAIVKMKKLRLLAVRSQQDELLRRLLTLGCVQIEPPEPASPELAAMMLPRPDEAQESRENKALLERALVLLDKYAPVKSPLFATRPLIPLEEFLDVSSMEAALEDARELERLDEAVRKVAEQETRRRGIIESLKPWEGLDLPLETRGTKTCSLTLGAVPNIIKTEYSQALAEAAPQAELVEISADKERRYLLLICAKDQETAAMDALRETGFAQIATPSAYGTAAENIKQCQAELKELAEKKDSLMAVARAFGERREALRLCRDRAAALLERAEAAAMLPRTESVMLLQGWVTAPEEEKLSQLLSQFVCAWDLSDPEPEEYPETPICLKNNKLSEPLMMVTEMYSLPSYDGIDPNPLMLPFFSLFFGIMYADMGYGIILMVLGFLALKLRPRGTLKYMAGLLRICGATTFVFGALTGSFFGDAIPQIAAMYGKTVALPSLFSPLQDPLLVLIGALVLGCIQIIVGMGIGAYMSIRDGHWKDALFDVGSWWLLFAGIALGALGVTWWVAIAGVAALILTQGRAKPTIFGKFIGGIASLYNITSYFGDILSYSRLMALMLAGSVIASVMNTLGSLFGNLIGFFVVFLVGHAFNMGLNIIGCYVHTSRLMYLEYFGKFYRDGGRPFRPFSIKTKYVDITQ